MARAIFESLPETNISIIEQDAYYKDQTHLEMEDRVKTNYDHPLAFDTDLLIKHIQTLSTGCGIDKPIYDFSQYTRSTDTVRVESRDIIIIEGIMIFEDKRLRDIMDIKIFVDTDADIRIIRRITRDIRERGRTLECVIGQYLSTVKPAHEQFIEPTKKFCRFNHPRGWL